jgi:hypothetical protein
MLLLFLLWSLRSLHNRLSWNHRRWRSAAVSVGAIGAAGWRLGFLLLLLLVLLVLLLPSTHCIVHHAINMVGGRTPSYYSIRIVLTAYVDVPSPLHVVLLLKHYELLLLLLKLLNH